MTARARLTPHMQGYQAKFTDAGDVRWLPYLMYFHPAGYRSEVVNTDASGFRYSAAQGRRYSVADHDGIDSVRLLAGSSTAFGIGASTDGWTLPSRMTVHDPRPQPWLNFGGRSFNSTQEMLLLTMYRHLLPKVEEIVLFSGFNNLGLARLPEAVRGEHGAFFNCNAFFEAFGLDGSNASNGPASNGPASNGPASNGPASDGAAGGRRRRSMRHRLGRGGPESAGAQPERPPSVDAQLAYAAELTLRHLDIWRAIAADLGASLTFVLQPLAGWVREVGSAEEEELFAELDELGRFSEVYGDILTTSVNSEYAAAIEAGAKQLGVDFVNLSPILADRLTPDQWLFVDRIHFTDDGHDFVARLLLDLLDH